MANFEKGDVVNLKSGGPNMTVYEIQENNEVMCQWFDNKDVLVTGVFAQESLEKTKDDEGPTAFGNRINGEDL